MQIYSFVLSSTKRKTKIMPSMTVFSKSSTNPGYRIINSIKFTTLKRRQNEDMIHYHVFNRKGWEIKLFRNYVNVKEHHRETKKSDFLQSVMTFEFSSFLKRKGRTVPGQKLLRNVIAMRNKSENLVPANSEMKISQCHHFV